MKLKVSYPTSGLRILGRGSLAIVYKVHEQVVLKVPIEKNSTDFINENRIFDILEDYPHPGIVQSFLRLDNANFLQFLGSGDLANRLWKRQVRDPADQHVLSVLEKEPEYLVRQWLIQLSDAAAWLEFIGLAHCDIRPANILLDTDDHIKLADFDLTVRAGQPLEVGTAPFARLLGEEGCQDRGTYGLSGPRTEQFALGSVFYAMTRGHDPYEDKWFGHDHIPKMMDMLQSMTFPRLGQSDIDKIIHACWFGRFDTVKQLFESVSQLSGHREETMVSMNGEEQKALCRHLVRIGVLEAAKDAKHSLLSI